MVKSISMFLMAASLAAASAMTACSETDGTKYNIERGSVNGLPTVVTTESTTGQAKVTAIDYGDRSIALEGADGNTEIFTVPRYVRNFDQIKKGDTVRAQYTNVIKATVRKMGEPLSSTSGVSVDRAPAGEKPGITLVRTAEILGNVQAIDYSSRRVTLMGTSGRPVTFTASKELQNFDKVAVGDQVVFAYTETVVIEVVK